jgi:hypothetical protein
LVFLSAPSPLLLPGASMYLYYVPYEILLSPVGYIDPPLRYQMRAAFSQSARPAVAAFLWLSRGRGGGLKQARDGRVPDVSQAQQSASQPVRPPAIARGGAGTCRTGGSGGGAQLQVPPNSCEGGRTCEKDDVFVVLLGISGYTAAAVATLSCCILSG